MNDVGFVLREIRHLELLNLDEEELQKIRWKRISYIPQSSMNVLNPVVRIVDRMADAIKAHESSLSKTELSDGTRELLRMVGLQEKVARRYPHELSRGMKQRTIIDGHNFKTRATNRGRAYNSFRCGHAESVIQALKSIQENMHGHKICNRRLHSMKVRTEVMPQLINLERNHWVECHLYSEKNK